jgi:hypothetical protein
MKKAGKGQDFKEHFNYGTRHWSGAPTLIFNYHCEGLRSRLKWILPAKRPSV